VAIRAGADEAFARARIFHTVSWAQTEGILYIEAASWSFNDGAHAMFGGLALSQRRPALN
jgi:hypothetical protein